MHADQNVLTSSVAAVMRMPRSADEQRSMIQEAFDRRDREREAVRIAREESRAREYQLGLQTENDIDPATFRIMDIYRKMKAPRRSKVYFQVAVFSNALGFDKDVPYEEDLEDETGPIADRGRFAQQSGMGKYGPAAGKTARSESSSVRRTRVNMRLVMEMLDNLRAGRPVWSKPGRPSNEEAAAKEEAHRLYAEEMEIQLQQSRDRHLLAVQSITGESQAQPEPAADTDQDEAA